MVGFGGFQTLKRGPGVANPCKPFPIPCRVPLSSQAQHQVRDFRAMAQEVYAEWVGAQARVALLEAHAECRAFAAGLPDQATNALVTEAQQPYER